MNRKRFSIAPRFISNLHAHPDSSKFPSFALQGGEEVRGALPCHGRNGAGFGGQHQFAALCVGNANPLRQRPRQMPANDGGQRIFAAATGVPCGDRRVGGKDVLQGLRRTRHGGAGPSGFHPAAD